MPDISFNEINRRLHGRVDPAVLTVIGELYLFSLETQRQCGLVAKALVAVVDQMGEVVELHHTTNERMKTLAQHGSHPGVDVQSMPGKGHED